MTTQAVSSLQQNLRGRVVEPKDTDYDAVRALYNGMIDKRPRLIARCVDAADIIAAVNFGRESGMLTAIRGGGHNGPGLGSCDDGLLIDRTNRGEVEHPGIDAAAGENLGSLHDAMRQGAVGDQSDVGTLAQEIRLAEFEPMPLRKKVGHSDP